MNANDLLCCQQPPVNVDNVTSLPVVEQETYEHHQQVDRAIKKRKRCSHGSERDLLGQHRCNDCGEKVTRIKKQRLLHEHELFEQCNHFSDTCTFGIDDQCCNGCGFNIDVVIDSMVSTLKNEKDRCFVCDSLKPVGELNYWRKEWADKFEEDLNNERHWRYNDMYTTLQRFRYTVDTYISGHTVICSDCEINDRHLACYRCDNVLKTRKEKRFLACRKCIVDMFVVDETDHDNIN